MEMGRSHIGRLARPVDFAARDLGAAQPCVTIEVRSVYGAPKAYPACDRACAFARIAGTTTLTGATLREIAGMGFEIISRANADWRGVA